MEHVHESPYVMLVPLFVLGAGALLAGLVFEGVFIGEGQAEFWKGSVFFDSHIFEAMHHAAWWVSFLPTLAMIIGAVIAIYFYLVNTEAPRRLAATNEWLYRFLLNKWYFDELYDFLFVRPAKWLGRFLWKKGDGWLIDGFGPDGVSARVIDVTNRVVKLQSGYLYHYAFAMLIGVAALITYIMFAQ
jgi:NADH-quinone oxidoreductase subunit L